MCTWRRAVGVLTENNAFHWTAAITLHHFLIFTEFPPDIQFWWVLMQTMQSSPGDIFKRQKHENPQWPLQKRLRGRRAETPDTSTETWAQCLGLNLKSRVTDKTRQTKKHRGCLSYLVTLLSGCVSYSDRNISTTAGQIAICGPQRMIPVNFGSRGWHLCFRVKYLDNFWMDRHPVLLCRLLWSPKNKSCDSCDFYNNTLYYDPVGKQQHRLPSSFVKRKKKINTWSKDIVSKV